MNVISVSGNISEPKFFPGETPRLTFAIADTWWDKKSQTEKVGWINCAVFGKRAAALEKHLFKGSFVHVHGTTRLAQYEKEGVTHHSFSVLVQNLTFRNAKKAPRTESPEQPEGVEQFDPNAGVNGDDIPF